MITLRQTGTCGAVADDRPAKRFARDGETVMQGYGDIFFMIAG
ncbi:MAG: hypothetical protein ABSE22_21700 [Xanthobacteraceae bacterium]|jgi:hypothetical protein